MGPEVSPRRVVRNYELIKGLREMKMGREASRKGEERFRKWDGRGVGEQIIVTARVSGVGGDEPSPTRAELRRH